MTANVVAQRDTETPGGSSTRTPKLLLTPEEAAEALGISRSLLYQLLRSQQLKSVRIGHCRRIPAVALDEFVAALREEFER
jgi:excisionase family DNA binding protein